MCQPDQAHSLLSYCVRVWKCESVKVWKCERVKVWKWRAWTLHNVIWRMWLLTSLVRGEWGRFSDDLYPAHLPSLPSTAETHCLLLAKPNPAVRERQLIKWSINIILNESQSDNWRLTSWTTLESAVISLNLSGAFLLYCLVCYVGDSDMKHQPEKRKLKMSQYEKHPPQLFTPTFTGKYKLCSSVLEIWTNIDHV